MSKRTRWLSSEIDRWISGGLISREQASGIRALYVEPPGAISRGLVVFSSIGAVVAGLGIILLFAHNWHAIPKFGKLAVIFGTIAAAHAGGILADQREGWRRQLSEALCVLGTMAFGAGIWLVAQVYNIDEHFPAGFLIWGLGALAMAWTIQSVPQAIIATILLTVWDGTEMFEFEASMSLAPVLVAVGVGALALRLRSTVLTAFVLASLSLLLIFHGSYFDGSYGAWVDMYALSVLLVAAACLLGDRFTTEGQRGVMAFFGYAGFFVCSYIRSFRYFGDLESSPRFDDFQLEPWVGWLGFGYRWLLFAAAIAAFGVLAVRRARAGRALATFGDLVYPIALIYSEFSWVSIFGAQQRIHGPSFGEDGDYTGTFIVFNLVCLAVAVTWMVRGCRFGRLRQTVLGSLFFAVVVLARFYDLPGSLASRGTVFILLGGVLFAEGFYYRKLRAVELEDSR